MKAPITGQNQNHSRPESPTQFRGSPRLPLFDSLRGFALVLMAVFHFVLDLNGFDLVQTDMVHGPFWVVYRALAMTIFTGLAGVGFYLGRASFRSKTYRLRFYRLLGCAALLSLMTYFVFGETWIYFGILHFMAFASLLGPSIIRAPRLAAPLGVALIAVPVFYRNDWFLDRPLNIIGLASKYPFTEDFAPILPWIGVTLLGIFVASLVKRHDESRLFTFEIRPLSILGRHSLLFYMVHQIVLYPIAWLIFKFGG